MKGIVTVHNPSQGVRYSVYIDSSDNSSLQELLPALSIAAHTNSRDTVHIGVDGRIVEINQTIQEIGLHEGSWITFTQGQEAVFDPRPRVKGQPSSVQLRFIGGIHAGEVYDLSYGLLSLSSLLNADEFSMSSDFMLDISQDFLKIYPNITGTPDAPNKNAKKAAKLRKKQEKEEKRRAKHPEKGVKKSAKKAASDREKEKIEELHSGIFVDDEEIIEATEIAFGDHIVLPECIIEITNTHDEEVPVDARTESGYWLFARPPKIHTYAEATKFTMPAEPIKPAKAPIPIISTLLPLAMSVGMAYFLKNPMYLMFGIMSPVMMIASYLSGNRSGNTRYKNEMQKFESDKAHVNESAEAAVVKEQEDALREYPDPSRVMDIVVNHDMRLWNRRITDKSWLGIRVGTGTIPSAVTIESASALTQEKVKAWELHHHPVAVLLPQAKCLGISGAPETVRALSQCATIQLAALHSTRDLSLYVLSPNLRGDFGTHINWDFAQWLPQTRPQMGQDTVRTISTTSATVATRLSELTQILDARLEDIKNNAQKEWNGNSIVVIMDNAHVIRTLPGAIRVLQEGARVGIYTMCIDTDERLLPEECQTVVSAEDNVIHVRSNIADDVYDVMPDFVSENWTEAVAMSLAPIEDGSPDETESAIPTSSNLLKLLELTPSTEQILRRWNMSPRSTKFVIGESVDGVFQLDLSKDGPHGLIGGTTGSGKSELLQSLVASLAVSNTPDSMNFVLIDYKGGAAFKDCVNLPHTVGMVTDLDNHLVTRALVSLGAELNYREHILAQVGAKDIEDYTDYAVKNPQLKPLPRLLIVIDEFASLARELPDFVTGLVNIAQRGRSLGIHLLLATQRPGGVVSPEIRANTNLRIALRMTDASESQDVIDAKDAGLISKSTPGRAVVRLGSSSLIPFQSARVGGRYIDPRQSSQERKEAPLVVAVNDKNLGEPIPQRRNNKKDSSDVSVTDLKVLVTAISEATKSAGFEAQRKPWLPALDNRLDLAQVSENVSDVLHGSHPPIPFALADYPDLQKQLPENIELSSFGNLFIIGTTRSGKSTALRTIAYSASSLYSCEDLHIYCIDAGNGALSPLISFPNVGVVALRSETQKIDRLLGKLEREVSSRAQILSQGGYASVDEYNTDPINAGHTMPHTLVLLDSWDGYVSNFDTYDNGILVSRVQSLMREGVSSGVHFILTGDKQLLSGRMSNYAEQKIILRLVDKTDYSLIGMRNNDVPDEITEGRGFASDGARELQIALIDKEIQGQDESNLIRQAGRSLSAERDQGVPRIRRPFSVEEMPAKITLDDVYMRGVIGNTIPLGVGGEDNDVIAWNPVESPVLPIYGGRSAGKTTAVMSIALGAARAGYRVICVAPRKGGLRQLEGVEGIDQIITNSSDVTEELFTQALDSSEKTIIVMDDGQLLTDIPASNWLSNNILTLESHGFGLVVAGDSSEFPVGFGNWGARVKNLREGIVLRPEELSYADYIGMHFKRTDVMDSKPQGRGFIHVGSISAQIQMAMPVSSDMNPEETKE
ncbi:cell division protein FtsK [Alloscardovia theropitheci]|uniref:Cell division protein FtsK n=1 Tax=Alloscardovia theropitheci TaxID=2496842 RepID=A0A4R0R1I2_9BIFI|nr:FtsK/SpoIIIE domain-containing protein [Alloscardovia theropitheci]TCD55006.1 cell division protein FtsK [Alloscardovia theropitheci]